MTSAATEYTRGVLRVCIGQLCQHLGWQSIHSTPLELLTDVLERYLLEIGKKTHRYAEQFGRTDPNLDDLGLTFKDLDVALNELEDYIKHVEPIPFSVAVPEIPLPRKNNLCFPMTDSREVRQRADDGEYEHIYEYLPPMFPQSEDELNASTLSVNQSGNNTFGEQQMLSGPPSESVSKKQRSYPDGAAPSHYELTSVAMTSTGLVSPIRPGQGKLPEPCTPPQTLPKQPERYKEHKLLKNKDSNNTEAPPGAPHHRTEYVRPRTPPRIAHHSSPTLERALTPSIGGAGSIKDLLTDQTRTANPPSWSSVEPQGSDCRANNKREELIFDTIDSVIMQSSMLDEDIELEEDDGVPFPMSRTTVDDAIDAVVGSQEEEEDPYHFMDDKPPSAQMQGVGLEHDKSFTEKHRRLIKVKPSSAYDKDDIASEKGSKPKKNKGPESQRLPDVIPQPDRPTQAATRPKPVSTVQSETVSAVTIKGHLAENKPVPPKLAPVESSWPRVSLERLTPEDVSTKRFDFASEPTATPLQPLATPSVVSETVSVTPISADTMVDYRPADVIRHKKDKERSKEQSTHKKDKKRDKEKKKKKDKDRDRDRERKERKEEKHKSKHEPAFVPKLKFKFGTGSQATGPSVTVSSEEPNAKSPTRAKEIPKLVIKPVLPPSSPKESETHVLSSNEHKSKHSPAPATIKSPHISSPVVKAPPPSRFSPPPSVAVTPLPPTTHSSAVVPRTVMAETVETVAEEPGEKVWICPACKFADDGSPMVGCDICDDWYHWPCVGLTAEPTQAEWYCKQCALKKMKKKKKKKHKHDD